MIPNYSRELLIPWFLRKRCILEITIDIHKDYYILSNSNPIPLTRHILQLRQVVHFKLLIQSSTYDVTIYFIPPRYHMEGKSLSFDTPRHDLTVFTNKVHVLDEEYNDAYEYDVWVQV